jgi:hypothetical protein
MYHFPQYIYTIVANLIRKKMMNTQVEILPRTKREAIHTPVEARRGTLPLESTEPS